MLDANRSAAEPGSDATVFAIGVDVVSVTSVLSSSSAEATTSRRGNFMHPQASHGSGPLSAVGRPARRQTPGTIRARAILTLVLRAEFLRRSAALAALALVPEVSSGCSGAGP